MVHASTDLVIHSVVCSPKVEALKTAYSKYEGRVEVVVVLSMTLLKEILRMPSAVFLR